MEDKINFVLKQITRQANRENIPIIGWEKGKILEDLVKKKKPLHAVEIGTGIGFSGLLIIRNLPSDGKFTTVEVDPNRAEAARYYFKKAGVNDRVRIVIGDAKRMIKIIDEPIDLLFIDAVKEEYLVYLEEAEELLSNDAIIIADNVERFKHAVADYVDYVKKSPLYESKTVHVIEVDDALEVSRFLGNKAKVKKSIFA